MRDAVLAVVLLAAATPARASAPSAEVTVTVGAPLQALARTYGPAELPELERDLRAAVATRAARGGFTRLELVLEDAVPNRPTAAMLGRNLAFDLRSLSRGGARVSGVAYGPAGARPIRFSLWSFDLADSAGSGVWTDAERAFQLLGAELAHGRAPDRFDDRDRPSPWPPSGSPIGRTGRDR